MQSKRQCLLFGCLALAIVFAAILISVVFNMPYCSLCVWQRWLFLALSASFFAAALNRYILVLVVLASCWGLKIAIMQIVGVARLLGGVCYLNKSCLPGFSYLSAISFLFFTIAAIWVFFRCSEAV